MITAPEHVLLIVSPTHARGRTGIVPSGAFKGSSVPIVLQSAAQTVSTIFACGLPGNALLGVDPDSMGLCVSINVVCIALILMKRTENFKKCNLSFLHLFVRRYKSYCIVVHFQVRWSKLSKIYF